MKVSKTKKKRSAGENLECVIYMSEHMKVTKFSTINFLRNIRPFCKTRRMTDDLFYIKIRGSRFGLKIQIKDSYFKVYSNACLKWLFEFPVVSSKQLLQKLIKHELLK